MPKRWKISVVDMSNWPDPALGVAGQMLRDYCVSLHQEITGLCEADIILLTCVHPYVGQRIPAIRKQNPNAPVFVGGAGALSPGGLGHFADAVVLGDYTSFLFCLFRRGVDAAMRCPNVYVDGEECGVSIDESFPWEASGKYRAAGGKVCVFLSRGCRRKCAFCQTGWSLNFKENPHPQNALAGITGDPQYITNAMGDLSFAKEISPTAAVSDTFDNLRKKGGAGTSRLLRIGVEGVSERLRRAIGKPISTQDLVDYTIGAMNGGTSVRWFLISGLPYEETIDWVEWRETMAAMCAIANKGVLQVSFTAFVPEPASPLAGAPYSDDYYEHYRNFRGWFFDVARNPHISVFSPQMPKNREPKAAAQMHPGNLRVLYPHREALSKVWENYRRAMSVPVPNKMTRKTRTPTEQHMKKD